MLTEGAGGSVKRRPGAKGVHAKGVITGQAKGARSLRDHASHELPSLLAYCAAVRHNRRALSRCLSSLLY